MASIELEDSSNLKDWQGAFRNAVLTAMDDIAESYGVSKPLQDDLPALFRALDPLAETLWLRGAK